MGRPIKSTEEHIKDGTYRKDRHENRGVSLDALESLECPKTLTKKAKAKWQEIIPPLLDAGLITIVDLEILTDAFTNYAIAQDCLEKVENVGFGDYLATLNKFKEVNLLDEYNSKMDKFNKIMMKFGITPEARAKIKVKPKEKDTNDFLKSLMGNG